MNPFDLTEEEKQELLSKRETIRKRLKEEGQDTITLEEQKVFIECQQAFRTEKFQLAKEEKEKKTRKKKSEKSLVDLFGEEKEIKPKAKKLTKKFIKQRVKELTELQLILGLSEEQATELAELNQYVK